MSDIIPENVTEASSFLQFISMRMVMFHHYDQEYTHRLKYEAFMLMFMYEYMHEQVVLRFPVETDIAKNPQDIKEAHNNTLAQLIRLWKRDIQNVDGTRTSMKVEIS